MAYSHRKKGFKLLNGHGLEIGALHEPAPVPSRCQMTYADALSKEDAKDLFKEIDANKLVDVDVIVDLDKEGLGKINDNEFDFVILNHVIEHVANPINVVSELFRVCKDGGMIVIAAPDKRFTFDKDRSITSFTHLSKEYEENVSEVSDEHYLDFLKHVHPDVMLLSEEKIQKSLEGVRNRREHAHVWDSSSFKDFLQKTIELLNLECTLRFESLGDSNKIEYFSVWQKGNQKKRVSLISKIFNRNGRNA
ncbi:MAG: methyltransferase domain-containing protein [Bacteroidia bacterium]|nr:methyltransferase domain-containing protein [Bacteroidia bacterium]